MRRAFFLLFLFACRSTETIEAPPDPREDAIIDGVADQDVHAAVVMLAHSDGESYALCTATLVAPRVLLTAAHCVLADPPTYVSCGGSVSDRAMAPLDAGELFVHTGPKPKLEAQPAALGQRLFMPKVTTLCDRDVAVLVLDRALSPKPIAIASALPAADASVTAVGYGKTEHDTYGERRRREGMQIVSVGPERSGGFWLGAHELETTAGPCSGDSGGPLLTEAGEIVGVVSRGGNCRAERGNIYSNATAYTALVKEAIDWADAHP
jgi:hypothetical protein